MNDKKGLRKCSSCGSTEIMFDEDSGKLKCKFCKHIFEQDILEELEYSEIDGKRVSEGAKDIVHDKDFITLKCSGCGADIVINTSECLQAKCFWCRSILSINEQVPNGSVPDAILPFLVTKEDAKELAYKFVKKKKLFINSKFKEEFLSDEMKGVYIPYMICNINGHVDMNGEAEHKKRTHWIASFFSKKKTYYLVESYKVKREFDIDIKNLIIESDEERINNTRERTNNIINTILPFDVENSVEFDANYMKGYYSERRNLNIADVEQQIYTQSHDVIRHAMNKTLKYYDRGVRWDRQHLNIDNEEWRTHYLPVWIYSYPVQKKNYIEWNYIAVNGRTKEVAGSVPYSALKILACTFAPALLATIYNTNALLKHDEYNLLNAIPVAMYVAAPFILLGCFAAAYIEKRYRSIKSRHSHEVETEHEISKFEKEDIFIEKRYFVSEKKIEGVNNHLVEGSNFGK